MSEERRSELFDLIERGRDRKLMRGGSEAALQIFRRAEALLDDTPELTRSTSALIRYRLGHLLLRQEADADTLMDAELNFAAAARSLALGPWPHTYRLAALARLRALSSDQDQRRINRKIDRTRERALEALDTSCEGQIQSGAFNAVELATYFLGLPYGPLEGLGPRPDVDVQRAAVLVGPEPQTARVWMSWASCVEELEQRGEADPTALLFRLPEDGRSPRFRAPGSETWSPLPPQTARTLACVLSEGTVTRGALEGALFGDQASTGPGARLRQTLSRTRRWLRDTVGDATLSDGPCGLSITSATPIFGAVFREALYWSEL